MIRDIESIIRNLDDKTNNDIIQKKDLIMKMFLEDPDLQEALGKKDPKPLNKFVDENNPTEEELLKRQEIIDYNEKIQHDQIIPFIKLNDIQKEVLNFIMFDIEDDGVFYDNHSLKKQYITLYCVVHEESMETEYGIVRTDLLDYIVRDLLCWSNSLGFQVYIESDKARILDGGYYARKMSFVSRTPNLVNKHMGMNNRYDRFP